MNTRDFAGTELRQSGLTLINRKQLLSIVPMCERTILEMERRGEFPRRFAVATRLVAWDLQEIELWITERKAAAVQLAAPGARS